MKRTLALAFGVAALALSSLSTWAATYDIDPVHTALIYRIKHLESSYSYGRFDSPTGTFTFDPAAPENSTFTLDVKVDGLDTGNPQRDGHLKSPDFFNAKQYPDITFKSTGVKKNGDDKLDVTGDLTIHGITKSITVTLTIVGTGKGPGGETRSGFEGTVEFKRADFDMTKYAGLVGEDVRLIVSIEGIAK